MPTRKIHPDKLNGLKEVQILCNYLNSEIKRIEDKYNGLIIIKEEKDNYIFRWLSPAKFLPDHTQNNRSLKKSKHNNPRKVSSP